MATVFLQLRKQVATWRCRWPAAELARRGYDVRCLAFGADEAGPVDRGDDVIWHVTPEVTDLLGVEAQLRQVARRLIVQLDDDWTAIRDIQVVTTAAAAWQGELYTILRNADGVIVATPELAAAYAPYSTCEPVVVRNYPPADLQKMKAPPARSMIAGWMGRLGVHATDIGPLAAAWPQDRPFAFIGTGPEAAPLHPQAVWTYPTDVPAELYAAMASLTVGVVPLVDHRFNRGKSWNKALEFLTLGVPTVAAAMPAYRELAGRVESGLMLCSTADEMVAAALGMLLNPPRVAVDAGLTMEAEGGDQWERALAL